MLEKPKSLASNGWSRAITFQGKKPKTEVCNFIAFFIVKYRFLYIIEHIFCRVR